ATNDSSGISHASNSSVGSVEAGLAISSRARRGASALQLIGAVDVDRVVIVVEIQGDRQGHGGLGGCQHDDEQRHELTVESQGAGVAAQIGAAQGDKVDVRAVQD